MLFGYESMHSSSESSDFENYDHELQKVLKMNEEAIRNEIYYIGDTSYKCNTLYNVRCGLSPARNFIPAVMIEYCISEGVINRISFDSYEWERFIIKLSWAIQEFFKSSEDITPTHFPHLENITVYGIIIDTCKLLVLSVEGGGGMHKMFHFNQQDALDFLQINYLISSKIFMLENLCFNRYYYNVLDVVSNMLLKYNYILSPEAILNMLCDTAKTIENYYFKEFLYFNKNKVLNDLDARSIPQ